MANDKRKMTVKVQDLMQPNVAVLRDTDTLDAAEELMAVGWVRHLPVVDSENRLVGMITQRDLLRASLSSRSQASPKEKQQWLAGIQVRDVMTKEVKTATPETELREAVKQFLVNKFGGLPILTDSQLVGMLTETDLLQYLHTLLSPKRAPRASTKTRAKVSSDSGNTLQ